MDRRKRGDIIFQALKYAISDRLDMAQGLLKGSNDYNESIKDIKAFERMLIELFGTTKSKMESNLDQCKAISIHDLREFVKDCDHNFINYDIHYKICDKCSLLIDNE